LKCLKIGAFEVLLLGPLIRWVNPEKSGDLERAKS